MSSGAAVNVPTNYKIKEKDVNAKLQLYGIYSAFANGKVPSNKQIDVALNSVMAQSQLSSPSKKLSPEGQKLVADLRVVIEQAKVLLLTKNHGNLLQDFIWQTQQISGGNASTPNAPLDKDTARQHGDQALDGLRTLGTLLISNGQFRKLLQDASVLLRDIAGDAASKAANKVNPSEDELKNIDAPAEDNTWHEVPDMSRDNLKAQYNARKPFNKNDAQAAADNAQGVAQNPDGTVSKSQGARAGANDLKETASQNINEEDKNRARDVRDRTKGYLQNKLPEERRQQTIWRLKKMVAEVQGHQDYQQAIDTLLRLAEEYAGHTKNLGNQSVGTVKGAHTDSSLQTAEADLKTLIERFANSTSLDDLFDSINQIYRDADQDPELKNWFKSLDRYIRRCLQEQGYVLQDASTEEWNKLYDQGEYLLRNKYRSHTDRILDEFKFYADQFDKDPMNKQFGESMNKLFLDLGNDENGQPTFKPHLVKDLTDVILPGFFEHIRYVPIPRIEYSDPMIDAVVENLVLEGDNLAPNVMEFGSDNYFRWGRKSVASKNKNKLMLSVSGIQCDLRDVSYYIKRKQGFPAITDKGVMDIILGGAGLSFKVAMETSDKSDKQYFFKVNTVDVSLKNMNIILKKSNHKLLFKIFKPLLLKVMTPVISKVVEKQVRDNLHHLDGILYQINQSAKRAEREAKNDPENAPNVYSRYVNAGKDYITSSKQKKEAQAKAKAQDSKVNVAVTQHDSLFPNIKLPGGISTKATEYRDLAAKGDRWESPIFTIGSAKESSTLPKLADVTRKSRASGGPGGASGNYGNAAHSSGLDGTSGGYGSSGVGSTGAGYGNSNSGVGSSGLGSTGAPTTGSGYGNSGVGSSGYDTTGATGASGLTGGSGLTGATGTSGLTGGSGLTGSHGAHGTSGLPDRTGATGSSFGNQVDQAFEGTQGSGVTGGQTGQHTTLGANNPVFQGRA